MTYIVLSAKVVDKRPEQISAKNHLNDQQVEVREGFYDCSRPT